MNRTNKIQVSINCMNGNLVDFSDPHNHKKAISQPEIVIDTPSNYHRTILRISPPHDSLFFCNVIIIPSTDSSSVTINNTWNILHHYLAMKGNSSVESLGRRIPHMSDR